MSDYQPLIDALIDDVAYSYGGDPKPATRAELVAYIESLDTRLEDAHGELRRISMVLNHDIERDPSLALAEVVTAVIAERDELRALAVQGALMRVKYYDNYTARTDAQERA